MVSLNRLSNHPPNNILATFIRSGHDVRFLFTDSPGILGKVFRSFQIDKEQLAKGINIIDLMVDTELAKSRSDAKRQICNGCVSTITIGVK